MNSPVIEHSRAQTVDEGFTVDVTTTAKKAGVMFPVLITQRVWTELIIPDEPLKIYGRTINSRLWDVLWSMRLALSGNIKSVKRCHKDTKEITFQMYVSLPQKNLDHRKRQTLKSIDLKAVFGLNDQGKPIIVIMLPGEDRIP